MTLWLVFVLMTAAVLLALLAPLRRGGGGAVARHIHDEAVYRDQLAELDRDVARGLIGKPEAEAARNEIARRLISAAEGEPAMPTPAHGRVLAVAAIVAVPLLAGGLYAALGRPGLPDMPLQARLDHAVENNDAFALLAKVEQHLAKNPDDARGWAVVAPVYRQLQRYGDAALAYSHVLRLQGANAERYADYGEMLVYANDGLIDAKAADIFAEALTLDPKEPKARYFSGLAFKQEGKTGEARAVWSALLAESAANATWRPLLEQELAVLASSAPVLSDEQIANAQAMSGEDRQAMIRSMVDGLEARLHAEPGDIEGWRRLIRSRVVLGDEAKAREAYSQARMHFAGKPEAIAGFEALARELKIQ